MEENDDNLSNKSRLIDIDETVDTLEPKECDVAGEKSKDFECVGREIEEAEASIPVTESENLSENCVALEIDDKFSDGVAVEAGELERKDELSGEIEVSGVGVDASGIEVRDYKDDEIEGEVLYDTVRGDDKNDELEGEVVGDTEVVVEKKDELQGNYGCQVAKEGEVEGNGVDEGEILGDNDQVEDKDVCEDGFDDKQNVCVQVVAEKKDELEVEGGMNVGEEAGDKVVPESEIKDEAGVELQAGAVCEEVKAEELKGDCGTEVVGEALCEVGNEAENKSEIETEMKVSREPVKNVDDMVEEEKVEMGYVSSQSLNEVEERAANIEDNAEHSSGLIGLAEDTVMEEKNLVMESVNKKRDDELDSAPESDDEEDIMETGREYDEDKFEGEVPQPDGDSQLAEDEEDERLVGDEEIPAADVEMETETDAGELVKISGGKRKRGKNTKAAGKAQPLNMVGLPVEEEDVCFVCFDGGDLVLCDRKYAVLLIINYWILDVAFPF